jgi:deazaflavin-dependent oxidoreductase (nitroreductase family)
VRDPVASNRSMGHEEGSDWTGECRERSLGDRCRGGQIGLLAYHPSMTLSDRLARFNRRVPNPIVLSFAGRRLSPVAIVVHRGRTSGRRYRTPVIAFRLDDGYVISLPYGANRDWVRNVLAAGSCTLESGGRRVALTAPEVLAGNDGLAMLPAPVRAALRPLRVTRVLRLSSS